MQDSSHQRYAYIFPFEKVPAGSRILIYGAGVLGQEYLKQILITNYCKIIGFIDRNHINCPAMMVPVFPPECIEKLDFDFVVIALRDGFGLPDIKQILSTQGVDEQRIVCVMERSGNAPDIFIENRVQVQRGSDIHLAYESCQPSISFYLAGGFGDMICHKRFLVEIMKFVPTARIDIYILKNEKYVQWLYDDCKWVNHILLDAGFRYNEARDRYSLAISVFGTKFLQVDNFYTEQFEGKYTAFAARIIRLQKKLDKERISHAIPGAIAFYRRIYKGENCYTWFNHDDVFSIVDWHVTIPFLLSYQKEFNTLHLTKYITVNIGNGSATDTKDIAKAWPKRNFQKVIGLFHQRYPDIAVVQIGAKTETKLKDIEKYVLGKDFGLIAYVLRNALFHLDIEGGLVHLASQIGTRCVVLYGPTPMEYFAYETNVNIRVGECHDCAGLYASVDVCARDMETPICMYGISPALVMEKIDECIMKKQ